MKKIGIITLYHNNRNYGGLLQAYALQSFLAEQGFDSEVVDYIADNHQYLKNRFNNLGLKRSAVILKKKTMTQLFFFFHKKIKNKISHRQELFNNFQASIPHSKEVLDDGLDGQLSNYDYLVVGSDQVWNPGLWNRAYLLDVDGFRGKKISYAASIGRSFLTPKEQESLGKALKDFKSISVRESSAKKILDEFLDRSVVETLDPTFLKTKEEWSKFANKPDSAPEQYIFAYFLDDNAAFKKELSILSKKTGLPIVSIPHLQSGVSKTDEKYSDIKLYDASVPNWVWLVQNASFVATDSFHGTAFSLNSNVPFISFSKGRLNDEQSINSRLMDLLNEFGLSDRFVTDFRQVSDVFNRPIDFAISNQLLAERRQQSKTFLLNELEENK